MRSDPKRWVDVTERTIYLRSIPVAAELPPSLLHLIASQLRERRFEDGDAMMREGEAVPCLLLLTSGACRLVKADKEIGRLEPPQSLGFLNIIARTPGGYDAFAEGPTVALTLDADTIYELMEEHFVFLLAVLRYAAERLLYEMQELPEEALGMPYAEIPFEVTDEPLNFVERILYLRQVGVFRTTNLNALAELSQEMHERRYEPGEVLWKPGDATPFSDFIVRGELQCETPDGRRFTYGPGTVAGGVEGLAAKTRWYTATAKTPMVVIRGSTDELLDVIEDNFELGLDFVTMIARGLGGMLARKAALGQSVSAQKRDVSKLGSIPVGA